MADYKKNTNSYKEALHLYELALSLGERIYGKDNAELFSTLYSMYSIAHTQQDFPKAMRLIERCIEITYNKKNYEEDYISALLAKSSLYFDQGMYSESIAMCENMYEMVNSLDNSSVAKIDYYDKLSHIYGELDDYDKAIEYSKKVVEFDKARSGDKSPDYAQSLLNMSMLLSVTGRKEQALQYNKEALKIFESVYGKNSNSYYLALNRLASQTDDKVIRRQLKQQCLKLSKKLYGKISLEYSDNLAFMAWDAYTNVGQNQGIEYLKEAINIREQLKINDLKSLEFKSWLSSMYYAAGQHDSSYNVNVDLYGKIKNFAKQNLFSINVDDRERLWSVLQPMLSNFMYLNNNNISSPSISKLIYNCLLLKKAFLLYSSNLISKAISELNDLEISDLQQEISQYKERLNSPLSSDERLNINGAINYRQRKILEKISSSNVAMDFIDVDWTDISNKLGYDEVAVEFFTYATQDCNSYAAAILQHGLPPRVIDLFNDKELGSFFIEDNIYEYNNPKLYKIIWGVLEKYGLGNAKSVYFSAEGILNNIAIEYIIDDQGVRANEKWKLYRLSSTRELMANRPRGDVIKKIVLYGGLNYMKNQSSQAELPEQKEEEMIRSGLSFNYLPKTKDEVISIQKMFDDHQYDTTLFMGDDGVESTISALDGKSVTILHFATHGFYWSIDDKVSNGKYLFSRSNPIGVAGTALLRSGLELSGAYEGLTQQKKTDEDGILTSFEISKLDLSNVDLVTLSACQTGLGDVTDDGVFGLQRGFKLAGTNTILMSLWEVDDEATCILMTRFYQGILDGESKNDALSHAQESVRKIERFKEPDYWAAFLLLDALN
ncbi:MAG: CHAT domain-containing protein [Prevotella sp.]|nr:CHAT domain-containing protein [Prevotella sp.]